MKATRLLTTTLTLGACIALAACGESKDAGDKPDDAAAPKAAETDKKTDTPAPAPEKAAPPAETDAKPAPKAPEKKAPEKKPETPAPKPAAAGGEQQALFNKAMALRDEFISSLESGTDMADAAAKIEALEPKFKSLGEKMKAAGVPAEEVAAGFTKQIEAQEAEFSERAKAAMMKLVNFDPTKIDPNDATAMQKLQADVEQGGQAIGTAVEKVMKHLEDAWPNVAPKKN